ncbi:Bacilysin biosynthesis oxidoreductase YwfH [Bacillus subtilis subsp. subtilis]|nr:Bacilysin biosynthesis oxidoreductase YwfH [Bacillus subtilis subsp. subtilis]
MKRVGSAEETAALAAFLASEEASYITGQQISADGGSMKSI